MNYAPDFQMECRLCGNSPCVIVCGHREPDTELCGFHFFGDPAKTRWETWNDDVEVD